MRKKKIFWSFFREDKDSKYNAYFKLNYNSIWGLFYACFLIRFLTVSFYKKALQQDNLITF